MKKIYFFTFCTLFHYAVQSQCVNNWLEIVGQKTGVEIGKLDITGNQITIEAKFNRDQIYGGGSESYAGDIVSKHTNRLDCNYLLRPDEAEITTNNGWFRTPDICDIDTGKTYYVAMVYDGTTLKFYRNGFLMSQISASGDLITNNWLTTFGTTADLLNPDVTGLLGYINEIRIWNVARTQSQLRQYMNSSLPNPNTQTGLLAYYEFNSLINLQGNAAWNGSLIGSATINQSNPTCAGFVADSCAVIPGNTCTNNWLSTPSDPSYVDVGNLSVSGNQITVEAVFNRTAPYVEGTGDNSDGDIVSKHLDPSNTNYLLRPNHAYITTTNGFFGTPDVCEIQLNKTYHLALVYDGTTLKYYRDGFLMSEVPATGSLFQNSFPTRIGRYSATVLENFIGYINEVRIWNVVRTQAQLKQYMNVPLPNPTTQTGLIAYYEFSSLTNLQGNAAWNGTLVGTASINQTNPTCADFVPDSCRTAMPLSLKNFQGSLYGQSIKLSWTTFNEVNTFSDIVERSYDGKNFTAVNSVPAKGSLQQNVYQFTDAPSFANRNVFYRIKFVDKNKAFSYSNILVFSLNKTSTGSLQLFPNPAKNYVQMNYNSTQAENSMIRITDITGKTILSQNNNTLPGNNSVLLNFQNKLPAGNYFVQIILNEKSITAKLVIE